MLRCALWPFVPNATAPQPVPIGKPQSRCALKIEDRTTDPVRERFSDGEYEWTRTILVEYIPQLLALLEAPADADILDVLELHWTGRQSLVLEQRIRDSNIPLDLSSYSG